MAGVEVSVCSAY